MKNLDTEIDNQDMPSDVDDDDPDEDPEMLAELEKRQEDLIEEFLEMAYTRKHEYGEEVKAECKANGVAKDETKKLAAEAAKKMDQLRRKGTKALKEQFFEVTESDEMILVEKVKYFSDEAERIRKEMEKLLQV